MKKKIFCLLVIVVLAMCLIGGIVPPAAVFAAGDSAAALNYPELSETEAVPLTWTTQPVVFVVTGLVCALCAMIAVSPLLIDELPKSLPEVNREVG